MAVDNVTFFYLRFHHFHHYRTHLTQFFNIFPPRPQSLTSPKISPCPKISYWHRPHTSTTRLPVLFLHGIGIGLYPYAKFLVEINQAHGDESGEPGVMALEIMPISFRITHAAFSKHEMCQYIKTILRHHGWDKFVIVAHSCVVPSFSLGTN